MSDDHLTVEYRELSTIGFPGYRVGSDGSMWTCRVLVYTKGVRGCKSAIGTVWKRMRCHPTPERYIRVGLQPGFNRFFVHDLVLLAFVGPRPDGMEACHSPDHDRSNNALSNLRWDTHSANTRDSMRHGTHFRAVGEKNGEARLMPDAVLRIRSDHATGKFTIKFLAQREGCGQTQIGRILRRESWKHI